MNESNPAPQSVPKDMAAAAPALSRSPLKAKDATWTELIRGIAAGRQSALAGLYDETSSLVFGLAVKMLSNPADAEEVAADVYAQVWRSAATFDVSRGSVTSWLIMLTRSRAIDRIRSRTERRKRETEIEEYVEVVDPGPSQHTSVELNDRRRKVRHALASLPPEQRRLIELAFFSGLSHGELAEHTALPLGTVKTRIRLGLMRLRESLAALQEEL